MARAKALEPHKDKALLRVHHKAPLKGFPIPHPRTGVSLLAPRRVNLSAPLKDNLMAHPKGKHTAHPIVNLTASPKANPWDGPILNLLLTVIPEEPVNHMAKTGGKTKAIPTPSETVRLRAFQTAAPALI